MIVHDIGEQTSVNIILLNSRTNEPVSLLATLASLDNIKNSKSFVKREYNYRVYMT